MKRSDEELRAWISEWRGWEQRNAPKERNTVAAGMAMGALETLDRLKAWLDGDEDEG
jgi:hypothetical protein